MMMVKKSLQAIKIDEDSNGYALYGPFTHAKQQQLQEKIATAPSTTTEATTTVSTAPTTAASTTATSATKTISISCNIKK